MVLVDQNTRNVHLDWISEDNREILSLSVSMNERGILYKMTAVLLGYGWEIKEVVAETSSDGYVKDIFVIHSLLGEKLTDELVHKMELDLRQLILNDLGVAEYLKQKNTDPAQFRKAAEKKIINVFNPETSDFSLIDIRTSDRVALLFDISFFLFENDLDIISFTAISNETMVRDSFLVLKKNGERLAEDEMARLSEELSAIV